MLDVYLAKLKQNRENTERVKELRVENPELDFEASDYTKKTWDEMQTAGQLPASRAGIPFSPRTDGIGCEVPNVTLKIPTGGGKTYIAVNAISRIMGSYLGRNRGFVLWIVPNEAIYSQTLRRLKDRQDPYRQILDRSAAGFVKIMEKSDRLDRRDVNANLCVMVLMLQSANRQTKDSLKMFRDRGDVHGFTPVGQQEEHNRLLSEIPNLSTYNTSETNVAQIMIKDSLGNALRIIRPVVVVDEGQKAVSNLAYKTLYDFNPCFVLELTATPKDVRAVKNNPARYANLLVEVTGRELDEEGMIKLPLNLDSRQSTDWRTTLDVAVNKLNEVQNSADTYQAESGKYIRPILLVQVERTGDDQRESGLIHALDVQERLKGMGFGDAEIAVKTAQRNDLNEPENQNLLSPVNQVRAIITKQALQEGWDCPFAYVLCALSANRDENCMTQLVGRILRQPYAEKTGLPLLDEAHVITHHAETADVVQAIKVGLEREGLSDLVLTVAGGSDAGGTAGNVSRSVSRREKFAHVDIYLPKVLWVENDHVRDFDYDTDLLAAIDWKDFGTKTFADKLPAALKNRKTHHYRFYASDDSIQYEKGDTIHEALSFDPIFAARSISDIVANAFVARAIVTDLIHGLEAHGIDTVKLAVNTDFILSELRGELDTYRTYRAEELFRALVSAGNIQFRLRVDGRNWQMPKEVETIHPNNATPLLNSSQSPLQKSLFSQNYRDDFNSEERNVAVHLDGAATVTWWHRNVARQQYGLQGWKRHRIYPDFIFACTQSGGQGKKRIVVLETKGDHLAGNLDTEYKQSVLAVLSHRFDWNLTEPVGDMELVSNDGVSVQCNLVLMKNIQTELPRILNSTVSKANSKA